MIGAGPVWDCVMALGMVMSFHVGSSSHNRFIDKDFDGSVTAFRVDNTLYKDQISLADHERVMVP